ncbi:MAG: GNAT family N-acetyltransferase [Gammaproteobacteria bacterium]|nr:GNAT family N-acetyltransferase [Gammaproteobacteria bacterium]
MASIRLFDAERDLPGLRRGVVELQEFERALEPSLPRGEEIADAYIADMLEHCERWTGAVFVADKDGEVVGFVSVFARVPATEPDEAPAPYAMIQDLLIAPAHRGHGLGAQLLSRAEVFAREAGATILRVSTLAGNAQALELYDAFGYERRMVELVKRLAG